MSIPAKYTNLFLQIYTERAIKTLYASPEFFFARDANAPKIEFVDILLLVDQYFCLKAKAWMHSVPYEPLCTGWTYDWVGMTKMSEVPPPADTMAAQTRVGGGLNIWPLLDNSSYWQEHIVVAGQRPRRFCK